ncbi:uncharacterized protein BDV14DRAFT_193031 [Aspergillus stella-maris]|uniref:uncharacterized protein n=1 Tax=Aspergillus stella-maris TaxID=1810926 RepID=UPI003CCD2174
MTLCNNRVFLSKLLRFIVGTDCEEVFIHSDILKSHSSPWFDSDIDNFAGDESILNKDTDKHIVSLVCQYLYTGDYSITPPGDTPPPGLTSGGREKAEQAHVLVLGGNLFQDTETPCPSEGSQGSCNPMADYTGILLTHARLHIFAAKYELQELHIVRLFDLALRAGTGLCENLIRMLCHYAARHIRLFLRNRKFEILLQQQPTLGKLLLTTIAGGP